MKQKKKERKNQSQESQSDFSKIEEQATREPTPPDSFLPDDHTAITPQEKKTMSSILNVITSAVHFWKGIKSYYSWASQAFIICGVLSGSALWLNSNILEVKNSTLSMLYLALGMTHSYKMVWKLTWVPHCKSKYKKNCAQISSLVNLFFTGIWVSTSETTVCIYRDWASK